MSVGHGGPVKCYRSPYKIWLIHVIRIAGAPTPRLWGQCHARPLYIPVPLPKMGYHTEFGRSMSNDVGVYVGVPRKIGDTAVPRLLGMG